MKKKERQYPIPLGIKQYFQKLSQHRSLSNDIKLDSETLCIRRILSTGASEMNYKNFFHHTLWLEECGKVQESNEPEEVHLSFSVEIRKMEVNCSIRIPIDELERLCLKVGDTIKLSCVNGKDCITANIEEIIGTFVIFPGKGLQNCDLENKKWNAEFTNNLESDIFEKMHAAVDKIHANMRSYIFPKESSECALSRSIQRYFNENIKDNLEQRTAVEHIASRRSVTPFLLVGPPGTGKTVTIVEAILQLVVSNFSNCVLVCAHSNTAVDNVARVLQKYKKKIYGVFKLFVRINSRSRNRVPQDLEEDCLHAPVKEDVLKGYRIILCTLNHSAKYNLNFITHVVLDEAAQATEPSTLIPLSRLTFSRPLILAGDDKQLDAVVVSNEAKKFGLGTSLMERLIQTCPMYQYNKGSKYMVMLKNNYRSDADIIDLPNRLFYAGNLRAMAATDPLSETNILHKNKKCRGVVFHNVISTEIKDGTSYYNPDEFKIVKLYLTELIKSHGVKQEDIGIITPYKSQVQKIKEWIKKCKWQVDVESVDSFQGQEKRVILITTVRGHAERRDASLGFVTDVKRFNVALTRAKAKAIVVGNSASLHKSAVWRAYIQKCRKLGTYYVMEQCESSQSSIIDIRLFTEIYKVFTTIFSAIILLLVFLRIRSPRKK